MLNRSQKLFINDLEKYNDELSTLVSNSSFLIVGGAGTIGKAVTREIFIRNPKVIHVVDLSENNLVELVRDIRSSLNREEGEFQQFAIDCNSPEFELLIKNNNKYDYILNLSALKHVRSEKDPYTLMRMIRVNIINTLNLIELCKKHSAKKFFCVSTDKAANPTNLMGATKRIMELFLMKESRNVNLSMARFANVAFSDGSLLSGFNYRFNSNQPISAPMDIKRYFITTKESGELCLFSTLLGENNEIFFPNSVNEVKLTSFSDIASNYLIEKGYEPYLCETEEEAKRKSNELILKKKWPCYFFKSDTTGEKSYEEFYTSNEALDLERFDEIGVIKNQFTYNEKLLDNFNMEIDNLIKNKNWTREQLKIIINTTLPDLDHIETGKFLDTKM